MRFIGVLFIVLLVMCSGCVSHSSHRGVRHIVQPGQTLYRIAKTYGVPVSTIVSRNRIKDPTKIKVGQSLIIPGARYSRTVAVVPTRKKTTAVKPATAKKTKQTAVKRATTKKKRKVVSRSSTKKVDKSVHQRKKFLWPVKGHVVKKFNISSKVPSKGIDIAAAVGSKVVSAAAGKVIYSGNGISGFGHVIIIEHDNALYTVYGYNSKLLASSGSYVSAGQQIARVGTPAHSSKGVLHFEVWRHKRAVDPAFYLK